MDPQAKDKRKSYSDLEAIITPSTSALTQRQSYWNEKFSAAPASPDPKQDNGNLKKGVESSKDGVLGASPVDTMPPPPPAYYLVDAKGQTQALYTLPASATSDAGSIVNFKESGPPAPGGWWGSLGEGKKVFGMRKNVFLAVVAGVCALILGLLVTILLVTRAEDGHDQLGIPVFSTKELLQKGDSGPILAASDLAAMNWTDTTSGTTYSGVVYQSAGATGAVLMLAIKNEATRAWSTVNVSASASHGRLDVLVGTPLAAANNNGLWNIYYLTSSLTVAEVYSTDPTSATGWLQGSFGSVMNHPTVMPWSGLGAMWQSCHKCDNALFVMWQDGQSGNVVYANMTNLTWGVPMNVSVDSVPPGTPVAISAFTDTGDKFTTGADHNAIRIYYGNRKDLIEMIKGPLGSGKLITGNSGMFFFFFCFALLVPSTTTKTAPSRKYNEGLSQTLGIVLTNSSFVGKSITDQLQENPPPKLASLTYDPGTQGWTNNFLTWVNPMNGKLTSTGWAPNQAWKVQNPSLNSNPNGLEKEGFSAVAQTQGLKIYLVSPWRGEIHEYATNASDPFTWTWQDAVDLSP